MKVSSRAYESFMHRAKETQKHSGSKVFCIFNEKFYAHTRCINWMHALLPLREVSSSNIHEHFTATCNGAEILQFLIIHAADERQRWGRFANISQSQKMKDNRDCAMSNHELFKLLILCWSAIAVEHNTSKAHHL